MRFDVVWALAILTTIVALTAGEFRRVCYFTNWSPSRLVVQSRFEIDDIDPDLCTHVIYAFAAINVNEERLTFTEKTDDNGSLEDKQGNYFKFTGLKKINKNLKTLLSVGGQTKSKEFPQIVNSEPIRKIFAKNCAIFLRDRDFDGIDIDWEYPDEILRDYFTLLLKDLREEFEREAVTSDKPRLLLTIAVAPGSQYIDTSYNISAMSTHVDFINVMTYDYFGTWSSVTGFGSPLYGRPSNPAFNTELNQNWTIHRYLEGGAPKDKLVLGLRGAGVSFTLADADNHGIGANVVKSGTEGSLLKIPGHLSYPEICSDMLDKGAKTVLDTEQSSNYAYLGNQWVGYDDPLTIKDKVTFAGDLELGGVMFWSFDLDDFKGKYCGEGKYPLMTAMKKAAVKYNPVTEAPPNTGGIDNNHDNHNLNIVTPAATPKDGIDIRFLSTASSLSSVLSMIVITYVSSVILV